MSDTLKSVWREVTLNTGAVVTTARTSIGEPLAWFVRARARHDLSSACQNQPVLL